jgi:hypothetical protein
VLLALVAAASGAMIEPALEQQLARLDNNERVGVVIALNDQLDNEAIIAAARTKDERWSMTVQALQSMAANGQAGLLAELRGLEKLGRVADIQSLWIVNAVYCEATAEVVRAVAQRPDVWFVQWNLIPTENALAVRPATSRGNQDRSFSVEWNVRKVKADSVWMVHGYTGEGVIVGDIDTGCDYNHPDLADHMWTDPNYPNHGWNFEENNNNPMDVQGHGTHTCGTVAGDGTNGDTTGMAPNAQIMTVRTKTSLGSPLPDTVAENTVMNAMQFCVAPPLSPANHAHLLTMSLGWLHSWTPRRAIWRQSVTNVATAGLSYFIAAGNEGSGSPPDNVRTPGDCPSPWRHPSEPDGGRSGSITVGATTSSDQIASFSSWGPVSWTGQTPFDDYPYPPGLYKPDISAPGENITSTYPGGGYMQMSGTSMATPCAAGVAALILEKNPSLLPEEVSQIMQASVVPLGTQPKNNTFGTGRIDAMLAIENTPLPGPRHDVAMDRILAPTDRINPNTPLAPLVIVKNRGTYPEASVQFHCKVESLGNIVYNQSYTLALLDSAGIDTVQFPNWNVGPGSQTYDLTFWHSHSPDTNHRNDTVTTSTLTRGHDVVLAGMNVGNRIRAGESFTLRATLRSTDYTERGFMAWAEVESAGTTVFEDSVAVDSVPEMGTRMFAFPHGWQVGPVGAQYSVRMWHNCPTDENRLNDTLVVSTEATDQIRVLWLYSDYTPLDSLYNILTALGDSVDQMNAQTYTPTLAELLPYDAVGAHSNYQFADAEALGNVLADYVDAGGGVVIGNFGFTSGWSMGGRVMTGNYATITPGGNTHQATTMGWNNPAHAIMSGVGSVGEYYCASGTFDASAESVASWNDGRPYVAVSANQKVAGVNSYPGSAAMPERNGDWGLVFHNALLFVTGSVSGVGDLDPTRPALNVRLSASPNPAQVSATVNYMLAVPGRLSIAVYDESGRLIRSLFAGEAKPGLGSLVWNLKGNDGRRVANGVYFCKLVAGEKSVSRKLVVR